MALEGRTHDARVLVHTKSLQTGGPRMAYSERMQTPAIRMLDRVTGDLTFFAFPMHPLDLSTTLLIDGPRAH